MTKWGKKLNNNNCHLDPDTSEERSYRIVDQYFNPTRFFGSSLRMTLIWYNSSLLGHPEGTPEGSAKPEIWQEVVENCKESSETGSYLT